METIWHLLGKEGPPPLSSFVVHLLGRDQHFDTSRAQRELGWKPQVSFEAGMCEIQTWLEHEQTNILKQESTA